MSDDAKRSEISFADFEKVDIRVGTIVEDDESQMVSSVSTLAVKY